MAFNTPVGCSNPIKPVSDSSLSTHSFQPRAVPDPNSKRMGTGSKVPWQMTRSQQSPRNIRIMTAKGKPHMARRLRHVLIGDFQKMGMSVIPWVDKRSALTVGIVSCFFFVGMLRFGMKGLFAYISHGRIIRGDFFPLMAGRTLTFR